MKTIIICNGREVISQEAFNNATAVITILPTCPTTFMVSKSRTGETVVNAPLQELPKTLIDLALENL